MIRLVWRTDVHMSDVAPSSRKDDWTDTVAGKLRQVGLVAARVGAAAVLDGGDFFHVKSPTRNSHSLTRRVAEIHATYPCPTFGNVGNHDCVYGDYSYLDQQPLGVLFASGVYGRCYDEHEVFFGPSGDSVRAFPFHRRNGWVDGDPFEARGSRKDIPIVRVVGVPYHGTTYDMGRFSRIERGAEDHLVCMAHLLASPSGGSMFEGEDIVRYADLSAFAPDVYLFGHWHKDQGVVELAGKKIVNIGSLTRGSLSQDEMARKPACAVLTFEVGKPSSVQVVRLKVAAPEDVFDVEGRVRAETRAETMEAFIDSVRKRLLLEEGRSLPEVVSSMEDVPHRVRERVLLYLERAGGGR